MSEKTFPQADPLPRKDGQGFRKPWVPPRLEKNADQLDDVASNKTSVHETLGTATTIPGSS